MTHQVISVCEGKGGPPRAGGARARVAGPADLLASAPMRATRLHTFVLGKATPDG